MITTRRILMFSVSMVFGVAMSAAAQECVGISPGSRGYASFGLEGTDAVTGYAGTLGLQLRDFTVQLHGRRMDQGHSGRIDLANSADHVKTVQLQVAHPITSKFPLCVFGGFGWTGYTLERTLRVSPTEQQFVTGGYTQVRVPVGISLGKEFKLTENFRVSTFAQNAVMYEFEKYDPDQQERKTHHNTLGIGMTAGLGVSYGPLMLRSTISNYKALKNGVGLYNDFPFMSLQLGVKF
jgi:hypothetical protein